MRAKLKILIVDDSRTTRHLMVQLISMTSDMAVVGEADDGRQAIDLTAQLGPDVILMDVVMPQMDGLEATRRIMQTCPTPIVLVSSSLATLETDIAFRAIKAGALTVLPRPSMSNLEDDMRNLFNTLRAMAAVQVIHHWQPNRVAQTLPPSRQVVNARPEIVAIAASTGGPAALSEILWNLPVGFDLPVVIVQHISADFVPSLVGWFNHVSKLPVQIARHGGRPSPGVVYVAPGNGHLRISDQRTFVISQTPGSARFMPSGDIMLESVARAYGEHAVGVVLTGMGDDGAQGLQAMHRAGAFTIAQDEATSVVFGMPGEAIRLGAARQILPLSRITQVLASLSS
jgi:two-component system chemotaxis response regulator CheB